MAYKQNAPSCEHLTMNQTETSCTDGGAYHLTPFGLFPAR